MSCRDLGKRAYQSGLSVSDAPYVRLTSYWWLWVEGWLWASVHYPLGARLDRAMQGKDAALS